MIKTISVAQNWSPIENQALVTQFNDTIDAWIAEGKYTGVINGTVDNETLTRTITRSGWADVATAQAYLDLVYQLFNGVQGISLTGQIVQE